MNRIFLSLATATSLVTLAGCARTLTEARTNAVAPAAHKVAVTKRAPAANQDPDDTAEAAQEGFSGRKPGDFVVYRFSGNFRRAPITLTQRVITREDAFLVVDMTFVEGKSTQQLRVRMNDAPGA